MSQRFILSRAATRRWLVAWLAAAIGVFSTLTMAPSAGAADGVLSQVAAVSSAGNRITHSVQVPAGVAAGDTLVLFLTTNSTTTTVNDALAGWTLLESKNGTDVRGRAWTRAAVAADAGTTVSVTTSGYTKSVLALAAYRSSLGQSAVSASASVVGTTSTTSIASPAVTVADPGSWLINFWSEKSSTDLIWTAPVDSTQRTTAAATGSGKVSGVLADSGAPLAVGPAAARIATTSVATTRSVAFSVVVKPGSTGSVNLPPVASFTTNCAMLACAVDASASTDPEAGALTYAWDFGDGTTGSGVTANHSYAAAGNRTITLTVSDGSLTGTTTRTVTLTAPPSGALGHTKLVPDVPRTDMPRITTGEIWDIEVRGDRVFIAGTFSGIQNNRSGNTTSYAYAGLASYNFTTGLVDATFHPVFGGGGVEDLAFSPDGSRLYVVGSFNSVNGVTKRGVVQIDPVTGATIGSFTANTNAKATQVAASNSTVYVGGKFTAVNGVTRTGLAAVNATTGAVQTGWVNNLTGGMGVNGELTVQQLMLTHDLTKLVVLHTGRQVNGQDRYGVAIIDTLSGQLTPWSTRLWQDNLAFVGGIQRIYGGDIAPDDSYFVASSASGGDRPPINDTVIAFSLAGGADMQPRWISRCFDSVYSVAITEYAVYVGGHFAWNESRTAPDPWPGLDDVGYGTGQGLSGYSLGDAVVKREHLGALNPVDGKAFEWNPTSNSFEGNKALRATPRGLFSGGDATTQGGYNVQRVAFFDFTTVAAGNGVETTITDPIEGRVKPAGTQFTINGSASASAGINRVTLEIIDRDSRRYLQDDLVTFSTTWNSIEATLASPGATTTQWSLPLTVAANRALNVYARARATNGSSDPTKATKKFEVFGVSDLAPTASYTSPTTANPVRSLTFLITGNAADDKGVLSVSLTVKDEAGRYLQDDGSVSAAYNSFGIPVDVPGALTTTWSKEITVPREGAWTAEVRANDNGGNSSLDAASRTWTVSTSGIAPSVAITSPVSVTPPTVAQPVTLAPGAPLTFSGTANDEGTLQTVEIQLRNTTSREQLAADGTWGSDVSAGWYRVSPVNIGAASFNWSYTTPFNLTPGAYTFSVRATDNIGLTTPTTNQGRLSITVQVPGDLAPDGLISAPGPFVNTTDLTINLAGTATDDLGVASVGIALRDADTARYLQPDGTLDPAFAVIPATLAAPGATSTAWSRTVVLPVQGDWNVTVLAVDTAGQTDLNTTGATARYLVYPGDSAPVFNEALMAPTEGTVFTDGRIFVSGRAEDNLAMAQVQVAIVDSAGRYMSATGTFTSATPSWRTAFLTSPGTPGSNFSYTTPVLPVGSYTVRAQAVDNYGLVTTVPLERHVSVTIPAGNLAPVAAFTYSCAQNVCTFDGRTSTDESPATLTYAWNFGLQGTATGPVPIKTFTVAGTYTVTLTVTDQWLATATATATVTIVEPAGNAAPTAVIAPPSCAGLSCNLSGLASTDPNPTDVLTYVWNFGDGTPNSTLSAMTHAFPAAGTYTVTLTVSDGWAKTSTTTRSVTVAAP